MAGNLVGQTIRKYFGKQHGWHEGTVQSYATEDKLYQINYTDGDKEQMTQKELKKYLLPESNGREARDAKRQRADTTTDTPGTQHAKRQDTGPTSMPLSPEIGEQVTQATPAAAPAEPSGSVQLHNLTARAYNLAAFQRGTGDQPIMPLTDASGASTPSAFPKTVAQFYQLATPGAGADARNATLHNLLHFYSLKDSSNHVYTKTAPALPTGAKAQAEALLHKTARLQRHITQGCLQPQGLERLLSRASANGLAVPQALRSQCRGFAAEQTSTYRQCKQTSLPQKVRL